MKYIQPYHIFESEIPTIEVSLGDHKLRLEVCQDNIKGLSGRKPLYDGMLFNFDGSRVSIHMKDCIAPLDLVFCYKGKIQKIASNCQPCSGENCETWECDRCDLVLELPAGSISEMGIQVGQKCSAY